MKVRSLNQLLEDTRQRREQDALRYHTRDGDLCMLCGAYGVDKRSLFVSCFYAIEEVVPEAIDLHDVPLFQQQPGIGYYLCVCKSCRGRFLAHLEQWAHECRALQSVAKDHDGEVLEIADDPDDTGEERNIPYRQHGATIMLTRSEWEAQRR